MRSWPGRSASRSAGKPRPARSGRRCWACAAPRAWCSDPDDPDTYSAGSFFTNPILGRRAGPRRRRGDPARLGADARYPRYPVSTGEKSAGVKLSAAWLIERAGFHKGYPGPGGRVAVSGKHTLALTNRGGSTADLLALAGEIRSGVRAAFGVTLAPEPLLIGVRLTADPTERQVGYLEPRRGIRSVTGGPWRGGCGAVSAGWMPCGAPARRRAFAHRAFRGLPAHRDLVTGTSRTRPTVEGSSSVEKGAADILARSRRESHGAPVATCLLRVDCRRRRAAPVAGVAGRGVRRIAGRRSRHGDLDRRARGHRVRAGRVGGPASESTALTSKVRVSSKPKFGSTDVAPTDPVTVTVFSAKIKDLTVTGDDGTEVAGHDLRGQGHLDAGPAAGLQHHLHLQRHGGGRRRRRTPFTGTLATVKPEKTIRASFQIPSGTTVGVAAPIIITFAEPVEDKAAAQATFKVTTDKGDIQGSWGWLQDEDIQGTGVKQSIVHFRPADVLAGQHQGARRGQPAGRQPRQRGWGQEDIVTDFTIGRAAGRPGRREHASTWWSRRRQDRQELPGVLRQGVRARPGDGQRHPRGDREVPDVLDVQPGVRLLQRRGEVGRPDQQQRRVHPRERPDHALSGQGERLARLRQHGRGGRRGVLQLGDVRRSRRGHQHRRADDARRTPSTTGSTPSRTGRSSPRCSPSARARRPPGPAVRWRRSWANIRPERRAAPTEQPPNGSRASGGWPRSRCTPRRWRSPAPATRAG